MEVTSFPTKFSGEIDLQTFSSGNNRLEKDDFHCKFNEVKFTHSDEEWYKVYARLDGSIVTSFYLPKPLKRRFLVEMNRTVEQ